MKKDILKLFKKVKLLVLDVDGVLTRGEIIYDDQGRELKVFNVKDGLGVFLLSQAGIPTVLLTAKDGEVVRRRAKDMGVGEVIGGILPKEKTLPHLQQKYKVTLREICFVGDDIIDIGMLEKVGLSIAVADAAPVAKKAASYVTAQRGGQGAVREVVDLILKAQGLEKEIDRWLRNPRW